MNIALDDIRSKAPKGATHYIFDEYGKLVYLKHTDDWQDFWCEHELYWARSDTYYADAQKIQHPKDANSTN